MVGAQRRPPGECRTCRPARRAPARSSSTSTIPVSRGEVEDDAAVHRHARPAHAAAPGGGGDRDPGLVAHRAAPRRRRRSGGVGRTAAAGVTGVPSCVPDHRQRPPVAARRGHRRSGSPRSTGQHRRASRSSTARRAPRRPVPRERAHRRGGSRAARRARSAIDARGTRRPARRVRRRTSPSSGASSAATVVGGGGRRVAREQPGPRAAARARRRGCGPSRGAPRTRASALQVRQPGHERLAEVGFVVDAAPSTTSASVP